MREDVELCLEVQVDSETKRILSNPHRCRSTLLDVTVVKPKELEAFGTRITNTLRADEVRKLITSLEKQRRKKQRVLDKLKNDDTIIQIRKHDNNYESCHQPRKSFTKHKERIASKSPVDDLERKDFIGIAESVEPLFCEIRRSLKNVETRITNMQDINLVISQTTVDESASEEYMMSRHNNRSLASSLGNRNHSVYHVETAHQNIKNLKSILLCQKHQKGLGKEDQIEGKCLCENCGIIGLLSECNKHPLLADFSESPSPSSHKQFPSPKKKTRFNIDNINKMRAKSGNDEAYITHLSNRIKLLEERLAIQEEKVVPKDYFKKMLSKMVTNLAPKGKKSKSDTSLHSFCKNCKKRLKVYDRQERSTDKCFQCNSAEVLHCFNCQEQRYFKPKLKDDKGTVTDEELYYGGYIWKWGEEILRPGIDLKNRIVSLLNDILSKFTLTTKGSAETTKAESVKDEKYDPEAFQKFMQHINTKIYNAQIDQKFFNRDDVCNFTPHFSPPRTPKESKNIDVSYVNPKLALWRSESPETCKMHDSESPTKSSESPRVSFWTPSSPEKHKTSQLKSNLKFSHCRKSLQEKHKTSQKVLDEKNNELGE